MRRGSRQLVRLVGRGHVVAPEAPQEVAPEGSESYRLRVPAAFSAEDLTRVLADEQRRIQHAIVRVRLAGGLVFLTLAAVLYGGLGQADWAVYLPILGAYTSIAGLQVMAAERLGRHLTSAAALIDIAVVYASQATSMPLSQFPAGVAGFSLGLFGLLVILSGLSLRRDVIAVSFVGSSVAQAMLMRQADVGAGAVVAAVLVLALAAALIVASTSRLRSLAVRVAAREVERRVAEEHRRASDAERALTASHLHESRAQNQRLAEVQRDKERLMQLIVHDLRAPLTGLIMSLDMISASVKQGDADALGLLDTTTSAANRLSSMIDDLLTVAKLEEGRMTALRAPTSLRDLLDQVVRTAGPVAESREAHLEIACDAELTPPLDPRLMQRLLDNLVANALRFTPPQGRVRIEGRWSGRQLVVGVHNDGPTIPDEARRRLFQKFEQASPGQDRRRGFGLGLYLCRLVAEAHDGDIGIEDVPGFGCSVVLRLPVPERASIAVSAEA
jgi:two-component system, OmpR family, heavy metal sensor histidine kinase CusS